LPRSESGRLSPGPDQDTSSRVSYHETLKELAEGDARLVQQARRDKARQLAAQQFLQAGRASSADGHHDSRYKKLPSLPHHSTSDRALGSTELSPAVWRPSNLQEDPSDVNRVSASTFGRMPHHFHSQQSASPWPSRDPELRSTFDFDSDSDNNNNNTNSHTIGTPETGGSIPIPIASETTRPKKTPKARRRSHGSSIMAKVFRRSSASPTTPAPPTNTPVRSSPPTPRHIHHRHHYSSRSASPPSRSFPFRFQQRGTSPTTFPEAPKETPAKPTKQSITALAPKTTDKLASAAAGFISKSTAERGSPRLGQAQGVAPNRGTGRESPQPGGNGGNGHGSAVPAGVGSSSGQGISPRGSPGPQGARVARGDRPRGSPEPGKKDAPSPRPSAERGRERVMEGQGLGVKLGVV
jgi:hypothetical protein